MRSADPGTSGTSGTSGTPSSSAASGPTRLGLAVAAASVVLSAVVLFSPSTPGPGLFPYVDKVVHLLLFALLGWALGRLVERPWRTVGPALAAYAIGSEVVQDRLVATRSGDWTDAVADLVGAATGLALTDLVSRRRSGRAGG